MWVLELGNIWMSNKKMIVLFNLVIGFYNLYLYSVGDKLFNLIIGALNIGVWAFFRRIDE
mgnify:CR=1 FL=1